MHFSIFLPLGVREASMLDQRIGPAGREILPDASPSLQDDFFAKIAAVKEFH